MLGVFGELLITAGVLSLLFVAWQLWIGDVIIGAQHNAEAAALSQEWSDAAPCIHEAAGHYGSDLPVRLPLVGRVSANPRPDVIWEPIDPPEFREVPRGAVALEVRGDSMQPVAYEGQAVIAVDEPLDDGDLAAVEMSDGTQYFKRWWQSSPTQAILVSVSHATIEPPVPIRLRDCRRVWKIVGVLF